VRGPRFRIPAILTDLHDSGMVAFRASANRSEEFLYSFGVKGTANSSGVNPRKVQIGTVLKTRIKPETSEIPIQMGNQLGFWLRKYVTRQVITILQEICWWCVGVLNSETCLPRRKQMW
jgi:hypothetical protein